MALEDDKSDVLGAVYMGLETSSKVTGQFFTPDNISRLVSKMVDDEVVSTDMPIKLYEPACGGELMFGGEEQRGENDGR